MSENARIQSELNTDLEVYRLKGELLELREQNRVLREALNTIACGTEDKIPPYRCIDFAMAKRIAQAALTATSQGDMGIETVTYDCGTSASGPNIARACPVHANCFSRS